MQPGEESIFDQSTSRGRGPTGPLPKLYRGRAVLAAFIAVLTELVVIAGVDNQGVSGKLRNPLDDRTRVLADYTRGAIEAATAFWWRFAPADGQATHVWAAQFAAIGTLVVLTWLGALAVARGSVSFGRVWVGTWAVVAAVAPVAIMVRNVIVIPTAPGPAQSRVGQAVYGYDAFGPVVVAGIVLGLVAGLVTAAVAVGTRRQVAAAAPPARGAGEQDEYYDDNFTPRYQPPAPYEPRPWGEGQWQGEAATTQLPNVAPTGQAPWQAGPGVPQPGPAFAQTEQFAPYGGYGDQPTEQVPRQDYPRQPDASGFPREHEPFVPTPATRSTSEQPTPAQPTPTQPTPAQPTPAEATSAQATSEGSRTEPPAQDLRDGSRPEQAAPPPPQPQTELPPDDQQSEQRPDPQSGPHSGGEHPTTVLPPIAPPTAPVREPADEEALAEELAVEEHTQQLPRVTDERE